MTRESVEIRRDSANSRAVSRRRAMRRRFHIAMIKSALVGAAVTLALIAALSFRMGYFGSNAQEVSGVPESGIPYYKSVTVQSGDTLSAYAQQFNTGGAMSDQEYVKAICELNGLDTARIHAGENLLILYYDTVVQ